MEPMGVPCLVNRDKAAFKLSGMEWNIIKHRTQLKNNRWMSRI
jgi:hypothetical protein